jgi:hypothetical protein
MSNSVLSKKRKVINYLAAGRGITAAEARSRFGVKNIRAMMSDIRTLVERYGNFEVETEETRNGNTRYFMRDTHSGKRKFSFSADGTRRAINSSR